MSRKSSSILGGVGFWAVGTNLLQLKKAWYALETVVQSVWQENTVHREDEGRKVWRVDGPDFELLLRSVRQRFSSGASHQLPAVLGS